MTGHGTVSPVGHYTAVNDVVQPFSLQPNLFQLQNVGDVRQCGFEGEWVTRDVRSIQGRFGCSYLQLDPGFPGAGRVVAVNIRYRS